VTLPQQTVDSLSAARRVDGQVARGTRRDPIPVADHWVVLHRVGPDRSGPLDSTRTDAHGQFHLRYHASGDPEALYFVSTTYDGVAYFSSPLRSVVVSGDDGLITVFDTTSGPVAVTLGGRHLIVGAPQSNGRRPIGEVYDLKNDSTVTLIARDSLSPVWSVHVPAASTGFQLNSNGELANGAISKRGNTVGLFAPLSPGIRQLAFTYELPDNAFPLSVPMERKTGVLELLVQEQSVKIAGINLRETAPVSADGRTFRRFLGQDVPANAVLTIDPPHLIGSERQKVYLGVGIAVAAAMLVALFFAARRARTPRFATVTASAESPADVLLRAIATLDADFERMKTDDVAARRDYETRRAQLKMQLAELLSTTKQVS
jgi:hypothetical protein